MGGRRVVLGISGGPSPWCAGEAATLLLAALRQHRAQPCLLRVVRGAPERSGLTLQRPAWSQGSDPGRAGRGVVLDLAGFGLAWHPCAGCGSHRRPPRLDTSVAGPY